MATKKISELDSAASVTSGDVLPIVQDGETKKVEISKILDKVYPVGSIYISILDTNPATFFGGVWQPFGQGRTLVGLNTQDEDFDTLLKAGGEKTHTLTTEEIPSHTHDVRILGDSNGGGTISNNYQLQLGDYSSRQRLATYATGGGQAHNIMQPYIVVSMWLRVG